MSNPIGEILSNRIGLRHGYQFRENDFTENGIQVIKIGNVTDDGLKLDTDVSFVSADRVREFENIIIKNGDILMSLTGNIGRVVEVQNLNGKILFQNYRVGVFYPLDEDVYKPFIKWVLSSEAILRQLSNYSNQSAQANFGKQDLDKLRFVFPKHKNQRQIAKILSTADAVIEKTQAAIAKYKAIKQGMLQDLFTRGIDLNTNKLRPRYQDAPHLYKESKLGMIPREWQVERLGNRATIEYGKSQKAVVSLNGTIPVYGTGGLMEFATDFLFNGESILIGRKGTIDKPLYINGKFWTVDTAYYLTFFSGNVRWLHSQLENYNLRRLNEATGVPSINRETLYNIILAFPKNTEQDEIEKRIVSIENKLQTEQTYLQKMQSLKKGLMEDLLCGKKQVKVAEEVLTQSEN